MDKESLEIIKNPIFFVGLIVLLILALLLRKEKLLRSKHSDEKIGAFMFGFIPLRDSFYDYHNKRLIISWLILSIFFLVPFSFAIYSLTMEIITLKEALPLILFPTILIAALFQGAVSKKAKDKGVDTTGLGTNYGVFNFLRGKQTPIKSWLRLDLIGTIIVIIWLVYYFFFSR